MWAPCPVASGTFAKRTCQFVVGLLALSGSASGGVLVAAGGACANDDVARRLESALAAAPGSDLDVEVTETAVDGAFVLRLSVFDRRGSAVLDRTYELTPSDCAAAPELLAAVVTRFLDGFPVGYWAPPEPRWRLDAALGFAGPGAGAEASAGASRRIARGFSAGAWVRAGAPARLGDGHVSQHAVLATMTVARIGERVEVAASASAGLLVAQGEGFTRNHVSARPWAEVAGSARLVAGAFRIGPFVALSPVRQSLRGDSAHRDAATLRAGISVALALD